MMAFSIQINGLDNTTKKSIKAVNSFLSIILASVLGAQKNRLNETVLLSTQHMFWLRHKKIIFSVTHS